MVARLFTMDGLANKTETNMVTAKKKAEETEATETTTTSLSEEGDAPAPEALRSTAAAVPPIRGPQLLVADGDVICGRGKMAFHHVGNVRFREAVAKSVEMYQKAEKRLGKPVIVESIIDNVYASGGRFLKRDPRRHQWVELTLQQQKDKVSHAIRDASKEIKRRQEEKDKRGQQWVAAARSQMPTTNQNILSFANDPVRVLPTRPPVADAMSPPPNSLTASILSRPFMVTREVTNNSSINTSMNPLMADPMQSLHHESAGSLIIPTSFTNFQMPPKVDRKEMQKTAVVPRHESSGSEDSRQQGEEDQRKQLERTNSSSSITLDNMPCPQQDPSDLNQYSCSSLDLNSISVANDTAMRRGSMRRQSSVLTMDLGESMSALEMSIASLDLSSAAVDIFNRSDPSKSS